MRGTNLWIKLIECFNSRLNVAAMDAILYLLSGSDGRDVLLRLEIGLFGKLGSGVGVALHGKVVQNQGIDITIGAIVSCVISMCGCKRWK